MKIYLALASALLLAACGNQAEPASSDQQGQDPASNAAEPSTDASVEPTADEEPVAEPEPAPPPSAEALAERGRRAFGECGVCHTVREGQSSLVGPNLFGIYGKTAGTHEGFAYSAAMRESGVVWDDESLDAFLKSPQGFMPGNRMSYFGKANDQRRAELIAYLKTLKSE